MTTRHAIILIGLLVLAGCAASSTGPQQRSTVLVTRGEDIFFRETFGGNGRTCSTCHRAERNFMIDAAFIATLPQDDPLFVAERRPSLRENFENPQLMRSLGLILENQDGFDDLENNFNLRGVPHVLAMRNSVASQDGPRTGWSGDGAPGDGSLRSFAVGAVIQHFPKTLDRVAGVDFRLPTDAELDALEAFMLSLGRQEDLDLPLPLTGAIPRRGQEIFLDNTAGKCNICHVNAGANAVLGGTDVGNANFNTGVEDLSDQPADLLSDLGNTVIPLDDGLGTPGDGSFNTPPLVEAADTGPFFHNNSVETIEGAVAFYGGDAFNNSPAGQFLAANDPDGVGIRLDATQIVAVAAFLRVINVLENIRQTLDLLDGVMQRRVKGRRVERHLLRAHSEVKDAVRVLEGGGLHPDALIELKEAQRIIEMVVTSPFAQRRNMEMAIAKLRVARSGLIDQETEP